MQLFADTANLEELAELFDLGLVQGVTTNPIILAREGADCASTLKKIVRLAPDATVCAQVVGDTPEEMLRQGRRIARLGEHMVVKVPAEKHTYCVIRALKREGISVCATTVLTGTQAYFADQAGADYIAPYIRDIDDLGYNGMEVFESILRMLKTPGRHAKMLAASIKLPDDIFKLAIAGADILTVDYQTIMLACDRSRLITDFYLDLFKTGWAEKRCSFDMEADV